MICRWCSSWHLDITCHELQHLKSLHIAIFRRLIWRWCSLWHLEHYNAAHRVAPCCSALQCVAVHCSALQCVAVRCSALHCVAVSRNKATSRYHLSRTPYSKVIVYSDIQTIELMICRWCSSWHLNITCHELHHLKSLHIAIFRRLSWWYADDVVRDIWISPVTNSIIWNHCI